MSARQSGFTIVEMIIVIVVIAILALFTVFSFNNYRAKTAKTEMKNEAAQSAIALKNYRNINGAYPATQAAFNVIYTAGSSSITLTYTTPDSGVTYCVAATSPVNAPGVTWYVSSSAFQPTATKPSPCP